MMVIEHCPHHNHKHCHKHKHYHDHHQHHLVCLSPGELAEVADGRVEHQCHHNHEDHHDHHHRHDYKRCHIIKATLYVSAQTSWLKCPMAELNEKGLTSFLLNSRTCNISLDAMYCITYHCIGRVLPYTSACLTLDRYVSVSHLIVPISHCSLPICWWKPKALKEFSEGHAVRKLGLEDD